jgi:signal peptidase I
MDRLRTPLILLLLVLVLGASPFRPLKVIGQSMSPTLREDKTYILDTFYWKQFDLPVLGKVGGGLKRGDIVVVQKGSERWVKRLVGLPGDRLEIAEREDGWIFRVSNLTVNPDLRGQFGPGRVVEVGKGEVFIVGDNTNYSSDSTKSEIGTFKIDDIQGIARSITLGRDFTIPPPKSPEPPQ